MSTQNNAQAKREARKESSVGLDRSIERLENRRESREPQRVAGELKGQRARGWTEKLLTRTLSGVVYVLVILACLYFGKIPTAVLLSAMAWLCCSEFFRICRMAGRRPFEILGLSFSLTFPLAGAFFGPRMLIGLVLLLLLCVAGLYVVTPRASISDVAISFFGPLYTSLSLACLSLVRSSLPGIDGALLALVIIGSMWVEDSLAYLVGSTLGKHKLAPRISPNKSWEGFYGGLLGCVAVWCIGALLHVGGLRFPLALICGAIEGVVSVMGDLFESRIKRGVGVKDSGNLLPGHGGMLDRADSVIFGCVVAYFLLVIGGVL